MLLTNKILFIFFTCRFRSSLACLFFLFSLYSPKITFFFVNLINFVFLFHSGDHQPKAKTMWMIYQFTEMIQCLVNRIYVCNLGISLPMWKLRGHYSIVPYRRNFKLCGVERLLKSCIKLGLFQLNFVWNDCQNISYLGLSISFIPKGYNFSYVISI